MFLNWYQHIPFYIDPIAFSIGFLHVRWYSLTYIVGFFVVYWLLNWRIRKGEANSIADNSFEANEANKLMKLKSALLDVLLVSALGAIIGGRLGYVLFYNPSYFWENPWAIISPFAQGGQLVGIFGMSFYGGLLGAVGAAWWYAQKKQLNFWAWADFVVPALGAGYFFGRLGNFLNGELWGRATDSAWGMYFPLDQAGLLRHPSQLYEAVGEGLLLFVFFWSVRNLKIVRGKLLLMYMAAYATVRFLVEFLREPDPQGFVVADWLSKGQALSLVVILLVGIYGIMKKHEKNKTSKTG